MRKYTQNMLGIFLVFLGYFLFTIKVTNKDYTDIYSLYYVHCTFLRKGNKISFENKELPKIASLFLLYVQEVFHIIINYLLKKGSRLFEHTVCVKFWSASDLISPGTAKVYLY